MEHLEQIFDELFKFKNNESVKHRGDKKSMHLSSDMGLLILQRHLIESVDDDGKKYFERQYLCRLVAFSGSGQIQLYKERELMSSSEFAAIEVKEQEERDEIHQKNKERTAEIFKAYGVQRGSIVKLKSDAENEYKVSGFKGGKDTGIYELGLRKLSGLKFDEDTVYIKSPDEIEVVS